MTYTVKEKFRMFGIERLGLRPYPELAGLDMIEDMICRNTTSQSNDNIIYHYPACAGDRDECVRSKACRFLHQWLQ
jgi:hypothetical protein